MSRATRHAKISEKWEMWRRRERKKRGGIWQKHRQAEEEKGKSDSRSQSERQADGHKETDRQKD